MRKVFPSHVRWLTNGKDELGLESVPGKEAARMYNTIPVPSVHEKGEKEYHSVRMDWILITDVNGNRRPQMHWRTAAG